MRVRLKFCLAVLLSTVSASWALASSLTIGTLHEDIRNQVRSYGHLTDYLEQELSQFGISEVKLVVHGSIDPMADAMSRGDVDIFIDSPLVAAKVAQASGSSPFLRHWKNGVSSYYSVIIVHVDSGIETLDDLAGRVVALQGNASTSGFMLPMHLMLQSGLTLKETRISKPKRRPGIVSYFLTSQDNNTLYAVATGRADAGATHQNAFLKLAAARPGQFKSIASSEPFARSVVIHRPGFDRELREEVKRVLTTMFRSQKGRETLKAFHNSAGFDEFPEGPKATFAPIFQILQDLEDAGIH